MPHTSVALAPIAMRVVTDIVLPFFLGVALIAVIVTLALVSVGFGGWYSLVAG